VAEQRPAGFCNIQEKMNNNILRRVPGCPDNFQSDPDGKISIAIMIAIKNLIRINQTPIRNF